MPPSLASAAPDPTPARQDEANSVSDRSLAVLDFVTSKNLQPLAAMGFLTIGAGADARSRLVIATEIGASKQAQAQRAWKTAQLALNKQLGTERVAALHELLDSCIECLGGDKEGDDAKAD